MAKSDFSFPSGRPRLRDGADTFNRWGGVPMGARTWSGKP
jgi:hypothetical protein